MALRDSKGRFVKNQTEQPTQDFSQPPIIQSISLDDVQNQSETVTLPGKGRTVRPSKLKVSGLSDLNKNLQFKQIGDTIISEATLEKASKTKGLLNKEALQNSIKSGMNEDDDEFSDIIEKNSQKGEERRKGKIEKQRFKILSDLEKMQLHQLDKITDISKKQLEFIQSLSQSNNAQVRQLKSVLKYLKTINDKLDKRSGFVSGVEGPPTRRRKTTAGTSVNPRPSTALVRRPPTNLVRPSTDLVTVPQTPVVSGGGNFLESILGGALGSSLGRGGRALMKPKIPLPALGAGVAGGGIFGPAFMGAGIGIIIAQLIDTLLGGKEGIEKGDTNKEKEMKDIIKGQKESREVPTSIKKILEADPTVKDQLEKIKDDNTKRKLLYSYGVKQEDIEKYLKEPEKFEPENPGPLPRWRMPKTPLVNPGFREEVGTPTSMGPVTNKSPSSGIGSTYSSVPSPQPQNVSTVTPMSSFIADPNMSPEAKALLDTIATHESGGRYNVRQGGELMSDLSQHPGALPGKGGISSAAGKYQFINSTWNDAKKALNLQDFSPDSQDKAAWWLAQKDYNRRTGKNLADDIKSKDPQVQAQIADALKRTWTSLPGGFDPGLNKPGRQLSEYMSTFERNKQKYENVQNKAEATASTTGEKVEKVIEQNSRMVSAMNTPSAGQSQTVNAPVVMTGGESGKNNYMFPNVRNDDPTILEALKHDIKMA